MKLKNPKKVICFVQPLFFCLTRWHTHYSLPRYYLNIITITQLFSDLMENWIGILVGLVWDLGLLLDLD